MSNESLTQASWLVPNVTNAQKRVPKYSQPWTRDSMSLNIASFTHVDVISDERLKLSTKSLIS